jgi:hypothetical protein
LNRPMESPVTPDDVTIPADVPGDQE